MDSIYQKNAVDLFMEIALKPQICILFYLYKYEYIMNKSSYFVDIFVWYFPLQHSTWSPAPGHAAFVFDGIPSLGWTRKNLFKQVGWKFKKK